MERISADETKVSEKLQWELPIVNALDVNSTKVVIV